VSVSVFRVLFLGEIVGKGGVFCVKSLLSEFKKEREIDFVIANGEGATGGYGIGKNHAVYLHKLGIDVITSGECIFYKKDMVSFIQGAPYILRPANYPQGIPGRGWWIYTHEKRKIAVINMLGQSGFNRTHLSNPFNFLPDLVTRVRRDTNTIIVDFHAATTAEKYNMFHLADGSVSAVIGTHTKALTGDEQILPGGTGILCDAGRTGSADSVGGLDPEIEINKYLYKIPERSRDAWKDLEMQGVLLDIGENGKTESIELVREKCLEVPDAGNSNSNGSSGGQNNRKNSA